MPLRKGDRLPPVGLSDCLSGAELSLRPSRGPRVLVTLHQADCEECIGYARAIASTREAVEAWGADILIITPGKTPRGSGAPSRIGVPVLQDPANVVADGRLRVIIADEWGEVYFVSEADVPHGAITPEEVVEWVRFIAIQCPECEGPEGAWRNL